MWAPKLRPLWMGLSAGAAAVSCHIAFPSVLSGSCHSSAEDAEVPTDKLVCQIQAAERPYRPVVLVSCGSFNPPTNMHLRMFELGKDHLTKVISRVQEGFNVLGGYMSPVNDAYDKPELLSAKHRIAMAQAAVQSSSLIMVDPWEASQAQYQRSLLVLQHIESCLQGAFDAAGQHLDSPGKAEARVKAMLLCGSDLVESFVKPGVWKPEHVEAILRDHGVVCIARNAADMKLLTSGNNSLLRDHSSGLIFVEEPVSNNVSSSLLRNLIQEGSSVKYLTPDPVIRYMRENQLYQRTPST